MLDKLNSASVKVGVVMALVPALVLGVAMNAFATADSDTVTAVTGGATTLKDTMVAIGTAVLPFAAVIVALSVGWRFARKFLRG